MPQLNSISELKDILKQIVNINNKVIETSTIDTLIQYKDIILDLNDIIESIDKLNYIDCYNVNIKLCRIISRMFEIRKDSIFYNDLSELLLRLIEVQYRITY